MYGLEAINAYNGWSQALTGACIVLTGLTILAGLISQLHKIIELFEKKKESSAPVPKKNVEEEAFPVFCPSDLDEAATLYKKICKSIGDKFTLPELYQLCKTKNVPHPYLTVKYFREAGILASSEDGTFFWSK